MQCPGQDNRYWDGEAVFEIPCPHCGNILEFFKDDSQRSCRQCGNRILNPRIDFGCAAYCSHAEQCLGSMPPELLAKQKDLYKDKLSIAVRKYFADNESLYRKATLRTEIAEELSAKDLGGFTPAVITASLLLDAAERERLLQELAPDEPTASVTKKLFSGTSDANAEEKASAAIFHDACLIADIRMGNQPAEEPVFQTDAGKILFNS